MHFENITTVPTDIYGASISTAARRAARILLFVAFTFAGAQLSVRLPFTPVPVTLQTLFVVLAGLFLGPRDGFYAMLSYLALGAAGVPVFAGFGFGPVWLVGPTGGYLVAFPAAALVAGRIARGGGFRSVFVAALGGSGVVLLMGAAYFAILTGTSIATTASLAIYPFAAVEVIKAGAAVLIMSRYRR